MVMSAAGVAANRLTLERTLPRAEMGQQFACCLFGFTSEASLQTLTRIGPSRLAYSRALSTTNSHYLRTNR